jgi:hypothetical protein
VATWLIAPDCLAKIRAHFFVNKISAGKGGAKVAFSCILTAEKARQA